jgi:hypothetical protein
MIDNAAKNERKIAKTKLSQKFTSGTSSKSVECVSFLFVSLLFNRGLTKCQ